jgi:hypothetical protein
MIQHNQGVPSLDNPLFIMLMCSASEIDLRRPGNALLKSTFLVFVATNYPKNAMMQQSPDMSAASITKALFLSMHCTEEIHS